MVGRRTWERKEWERTGWWARRAPLVLVVMLAMAVYAVMVAKAEFGLPLQVQLALFESQHGIMLTDDPSNPGGAVFASKQ